MKIVFMGTPDFAVATLKKLIDSEHEIIAVVTQPDRPKGRGREVALSPVKQLAVDSGIPVLQPEKAKAPEFIENFKKLAPDVTVVVAFGQILKKEVLDTPKHFSINLHSSLLPKYRGAAPINWAIINGETETGVTTMRMDEGMDTGDILLTRIVPIQDSDDSQTLHDTLKEEGASLVLETLRKLEEGTLNPVKQDDTKATHAAKMKKEDGLILWENSARSIRDHIRGREPWPGAFSFLNDKRIRVCQAELGESQPDDLPGVIARVSDHSIEVGTGGDGRILITHLQAEGKKRMDAKSFLAGHKLATGQTFISQTELKS
jgi:methionyl-tRNA formyltransferase